MCFSRTERVLVYERGTVNVLSCLSHILNKLPPICNLENVTYISVFDIYTRVAFLGVVLLNDCVGQSDFIKPNEGWCLRVL